MRVNKIWVFAGYPRVLCPASSWGGNSLSNQGTRQPAGTLKISKKVIAAIARTAAMEIGGVASLPEFDVSMGERIFSRGFGIGPVRVLLSEDFAEIGISLNVESGARIPDVCAAVQSNIKDSIQTMTGIVVSKVNVTVAGIAFPDEAAN